MKTNDLRIGNLVLNDDGGVCKLFNIHEGYINHKPIPLTEEWLLKLPEDLVSDAIPSYVKFVHQLQNWYWVENRFEKELKFKQ